MWLVSRTGVFTYFCIFFFLAKEVEKRRNKKKNKKNQRRNFQKAERFDNDGRNS